MLFGKADYVFWNEIESIVDNTHHVRSAVLMQAVEKTRQDQGYRTKQSVA